MLIYNITYDLKNGSSLGNRSVKSVKLKSVKKSDVMFLYNLLNERDPKNNISHVKIPTLKQHIKFINSKPYTKWYIIYLDNEKVGSMYITKQNEIGIHILKKFPFEKISSESLEIIIGKNPRKKLFANVSPQNIELQQFFNKKGFKLIQYTYELPQKNEK